MTITVNTYGNGFNINTAWQYFPGYTFKEVSYDGSSLNEWKVTNGDYVQITGNFNADDYAHDWAIVQNPGGGTNAGTVNALTILAPDHSTVLAKITGLANDLISFLGSWNDIYGWYYFRAINWDAMLRGSAGSPSSVVINGTSGDDDVGTPGNYVTGTINGGDGNDIIEAGGVACSLTVNGGNGFNTITLLGGYAQSSIERNQDGTYTIKEFLNEPIYTSTITARNVQAVQFYDKYVLLGSDLFTSGAEGVDFNDLLPVQQVAIAGGADLYHGLGGSDSVRLPTITNYNVSLGNAGGTLGWDPTQTFQTGSLVGDHYSVTGSDGSYRIALGAGADTVTINGSGSSIITTGGGPATIAINGSGANTINLGTGSANITVDRFEH
ncbi:hypothetical protein ACVWW4_006597 [Bradyrhizobium sp. LB7.1]